MKITSQSESYNNNFGKINYANCGVINQDAGGRGKITPVIRSLNRCISRDIYADCCDWCSSRSDKFPRDLFACIRSVHLFLKWSLGPISNLGGGGGRDVVSTSPCQSGAAAILAGYINNRPTGWSSLCLGGSSGATSNKKQVVSLVSVNRIIRTGMRYTISTGLLVSLGMSASCRPGADRQLGVSDEVSDSRHESGILQRRLFRASEGRSFEDFVNLEKRYRRLSAP